MQRLRSPMNESERGGGWISKGDDLIDWKSIADEEPTETRLFTDFYISFYSKWKEHLLL